MKWFVSASPNRGRRRKRRRIFVRVSDVGTELRYLRRRPDILFARIGEGGPVAFVVDVRIAVARQRRGLHVCRHAHVFGETGIGQAQPKVLAGLAMNAQSRPSCSSATSASSIHRPARIGLRRAAPSSEAGNRWRNRQAAANAARTKMPAIAQDGPEDAGATLDTALAARKSARPDPDRPPPPKPSARA